MRKFKVGDKVRCIEPDSSGYLLYNTIYEVEKMGISIILKNNRPYRWLENRFELVEDSEYNELFI